MSSCSILNLRKSIDINARIISVQSGSIIAVEDLTADTENDYHNLVEQLTAKIMRIYSKGATGFRSYACLGAPSTPTEVSNSRPRRPHVSGNHRAADRHSPGPGIPHYSVRQRERVVVINCEHRPLNEPIKGFSGGLAPATQGPRPPPSTSGGNRCTLTKFIVLTKTDFPRY